MPESRPGSNFGGRNSRGGNDNFSRDRKFGGGGRGGYGGNSRGGDFGAPRGGFGDRDARGPFQPREGAYQNRGHEGAPEGRSYERKGGFNDRFAGDGRREGAAPRGDFAARKPAAGKPSFGKPGAGTGKVFVPRDAAKRSPRPTR